MYWDFVSFCLSPFNLISACKCFKVIETSLLLWGAYSNDYADDCNAEWLLRFFPPPRHTTFFTFSNCKTLSLTVPTIHAETSFIEAAQISHACSMKAQPLLDSSQGRGINHSPRAGARGRPGHTSTSRDLRCTSEHSFAILILSTRSSSNWLLIFQSQNESYVANTV